MEVPDKRFNSTGTKGLKPKEGARRRLSGDIAGTRAPSLEFNPNSELVSREAALDYLAEILVEIYLYNQHERSQ